VSERFIGLDLGQKSKHQVAVLDGMELRGKPFAITVTQAGVEQLLRRATEGTTDRVTFVMEPTGMAWLPMAARVSAAGHRVYLTKPQKQSDLRKFYRRHTKTDVIDAVTAGRLPQVDPSGAHELILPTAAQMSLRYDVRLRARYAVEVTKHKRRIHSLLQVANPGLMEALGEHRFTKGCMRLLREHVDPSKVATGGVSILNKIFERAMTKRDEIVKRVHQACIDAHALYEPLRTSGRMPIDLVHHQELVNDELDDIDRLEQRIAKLTSRIEAQYLVIDPERTLTQLRGIGVTIAATIEATVGDVKRFRNAKAFASYCGLVPRRKKSGETDPAMPITKAGQRLLKQNLYLAADVARHWDPEFAAYYARRFKRGDHHTHIVVALAHKMANRVFALLKRRSLAPEGQVAGATAAEVRYILRDPDGNEVTKLEAREIIQRKYARAIVDPQRVARERLRKTGEAPAATKMSGCHFDTTALSARASTDGLTNLAVPKAIDDVLKTLLKRCGHDSGDVPQTPLEST